MHLFCASANEDSALGKLAAFTISTTGQSQRNPPPSGVRVSNPDSFIEEVTEEVRREKLYGYLRRYGWIAAAAVVALVGGAAFFEYRNAQDRALAEATGDSLIAALEAEDPAAQAEVLSAMQPEGESVAVVALWTATAQQEAGDTDAAAATLSALATNGEVPPIYRDLAAFKGALLPTDDTAARRITLDQLSQPGKPFRPLALEQLAYLSLEEGDTDDAIATLRRIEEDAAISRTLQNRVQTLLVALDAPMPDANEAE